jgi:hypothetical protein
MMMTTHRVTAWFQVWRGHLNDWHVFTFLSLYTHSCPSDAHVARAVCAEKRGKTQKGNFTHNCDEKMVKDHARNSERSQYVI